MQADSEFLKLVREYLELTKFGGSATVEAAEVRRKLVAAVNEIIQRQSQPQLWEER